MTDRLASDQTTRKVADMTQQERAAELREIAARSPATLALELVRLADLIDPEGAVRFGQRH